MTINPKMLDRWADTLLSFSLGGLKLGETVMIKGEPVAWPLISKLQEKIIRAGASADIYLLPPDNERGRAWGTTAAKYARPSMIKELPTWVKERYQNFTKYIEIYGMEYPDLARGGRPENVRKILSLEQELIGMRLKKPWVITMFPTKAFASAEGVPFGAYEKMLVRASTVTPGKMKIKAKRLSGLLGKTKRVRIITSDKNGGKTFELVLNIAGRHILDDMSGANIPCGEVFTSPDASSVEGEIFLDMPISKQGECIQGTYLKFISGKIVAFKAERGRKKLAGILETDPGARRLGEVAFGINPDLTRPLMHPLFCEKLAGTMHVALGKCFPGAFIANTGSKAAEAKYRAFVKTGAANESAQHVDLVVSFLPGGAGKSVFLDERRLCVRNGSWDY